jgi:hemoglobin/transferrin/lactoferrin receptor protein
MQKQQFVLASIALSVASALAHADATSTGGNDSDTVSTLSKVTVTANKKEEELAKVAPNINVVTRTQLDENAASDLSGIVKDVPGVSVEGQNSKFGAAEVSIRGLSGARSRVLTLVDDERLPDTYSGASDQALTNWRGGKDFVEPDTLKQVEVIKGPSSGLYGGGSLGGVVSYRTFQASDFVDEDKTFYGGFKQSYDGANKGTGSTVTLATKQGELSGLLMVTSRRAEETDNMGDKGGSGTSRTQADPQLVKTQNVLAKVGIDHGNHALTLSLEDFRRSTYTNYLEGVTGSTKADNLDVGVKRSKVALDYRYRGDGNFDGIKLKVYHQQLRGLNGQTGWQLGGHHLTTGTELVAKNSERDMPKSTGADAKYYPATKGYQFGVFVQDEFDLGRFSLTPSLRYDLSRITPENDAVYLANSGTVTSKDKFSASAWSPKLSIKTALSERLTGFVNLVTGFRAPTFEELYLGHDYSVYRMMLIPNVKLNAETSKGIELGSKYASGSWNWDNTAFYNKYDNFIEQKSFVSGSTTYYQYQNIAQAHIYGFETSSKWAFAQDWLLTSSLAWAKGYNDTDHTALDAVDPLRVINSLAYQQDRWGSTLKWTVSAKKAAGDVSNSAYFRTPGYGVLDLSGWYRLNKQTTLRLAVNNLTNKKYWNWSDVKTLQSSAYPMDRFTQSGRYVTASIETSF